MKIGKPCDVPQDADKIDEKIWEAVDLLNRDKALPVECKSDSEARYLVAAAKRRKFQAIQRGTVAYIWHSATS